MGRYLDRLHEEFDTITEGVNAVVDRAADENRDVTDDENTIVERDTSRLAELEKAIAHYSAIEEQRGKVANLRGRVSAVPAVHRAGPEPEPEFDFGTAFPSIGHYAIAVHRAMVNKDSEALALIERATAHQTTADNPGIIPRPVLGPVINTITAARPFIASIANRPLPAGKFDRPVITQHVAVGVQAAEKDLTASQKLLITALPVVAATYAGHLNISRQDIKWSSPSILSLVYEDFAAVYAGVTDNAACDAFATSVTNTGTVDTDDGAGLYEAIYAAAGETLGAVNTLPDTMWASPDVWGRLGGMFTNSGTPLFSQLQPGSTAGNPMGLRLVVDANFAAGTLIVGPSQKAEWFEDIDGLMQVGEPDVLGQMVGYAGFAAFLNALPDAFTKLTLPAPVGQAATPGE
jgi:HK97 family phage major capsid protein